MRAATSEQQAAHDDRYKWVALANTTASMFMATLDGSIVIIALPAIFRGIHLDPLAPGNISYLLWMIMGYRLVQAVLVVTVGRLGDMFGRVRIYNAFTLSSHLSGLTCRESKSGKMPRAARGLPRMSVAGSKRRPAAKRRHVAAGLPVSRFWLPPGP
jgi:MFS family permease